jgi:adenine-specific DNA-methyltransferase
VSELISIGKEASVISSTAQERRSRVAVAEEQLGLYGIQMTDETRKRFGAYYTPSEVVQTLVRWAVQRETDQLLDPSCGDGRFLAAHRRSVGIEQDRAASKVARERAPKARIHERDFFDWAGGTRERFDCAAGNPPFIRYQRFTGETRDRALTLCRTLGAEFSALTSSWAPFLVVTASLLKPGGRMAFVTPAEIGHAPYARPLLVYLMKSFSRVQIVAIRKKLFPDLSEDAWLLYAEGFGERTDHFVLTTQEAFEPSTTPPRGSVRIREQEWAQWNSRLRAFLLPASARELYQEIAADPSTERLGNVARIGIGYVTGANDFFHFRPSAARNAGIPRSYLHPTVRNGRMLTGKAVTRATVEAWTKHDDPILLLRLAPNGALPDSIKRYLNSSAAEEVKVTYKCRNRDPWYVVPDVTVPDAFLTYMSGKGPALVANQAECVCTNSIHAVRLNGRVGISQLQKSWENPLTGLSCEVEGHPLGGGILKLEPGEAIRVLLPSNGGSTPLEDRIIRDGIETMRRWRHHGG